MSDSAYYKRCSYISIAFIVLGIAVLVFGIAILPKMIDSQVYDSTALKQETRDIWSKIPGDTGVTVYKQTYLYDIENIDDILYKNARAIANETGPYTFNEFVELLNPEWNADNTEVSYNFLKYMKNNSTAEDIIQSRHVNTINVVALAVWYQAKNAPRSQVALQALYSILHSLNPDLYYGFIQQLSIMAGDLLDRLDYWPAEKKARFNNDTDYGLNQNNSYFVKACLTHPSEDSKFIRNYFDLTYHEVEYFKKYFIAKGKANEKYANETTEDLAIRQWLSLEINQNRSIYDDQKNITAPGYIEYGGYLRAYENTTSSLDLTKAKKLLAIKEVNDTTGIDNSKSIMNKKHMDQVMKLPREQAIDYIDKQLDINDRVESTKFYNYLNYTSGEMAFAYSKGGNGAIGAIANFLQQKLPQVFYQMGWDLYNGLIRKELTHLFDDCESKLQPLLDETSILKAKDICNDKTLTPSDPDNAVIWFNGILYEDVELFKRLNATYPSFTELDFLELKRDDSGVTLLFLSIADDILKLYNIKGEYNAFSPLNIGILQWLSSGVSQAVNGTDSLYDWGNDNYKRPPEFKVFCLKYFDSSECQTPSFEEAKQNIDYDHLFSGKFISESFFAYNDKTGKTFWSSKPFISYLRYIFLNEVLGIYQTRTAGELLWGYQDDLLHDLVRYISNAFRNILITMSVGIQPLRISLVFLTI
jgi:hypothetical protein